jgi:3-dehydroquinate synthase
MLDGVSRSPNDEAEDRVYLQSFAVRFEYPVYFTRNLFDPGNATLLEALSRSEPARRHRLVAVIDERVAEASAKLPHDIVEYVSYHASRLRLAAPPIVALGGEAAKNAAGFIERLHRRLLELHIDRHSVVVAVGGGAMLDMVGFAAATFHRGVRLVRVPTTVLAQDDSGVGVKNGINAFGIKNLVGAFSPPFAVINDFNLLLTLDPRDRIAGMAEAVKVALIRDGAFFEWIEAQAEGLVAFEPPAVRRLIRRCAELHMRQIATGGDPFETGSARPLDFGHWSAHKLEVLSGHELRHGEAVAIGMAIDARYSVSKGLLPEGEERRICRLLEHLGFRLWHPALGAAAEGDGDRLLAGLRDFREHLGGELTITLLAGIGRGVEVHHIDEPEMLRAVRWLQRRSAGNEDRRANSSHLLHQHPSGRELDGGPRQP